MAGTRQIWADVYAIGFNTTGISTASNASFGIPLTNHPNLEPGTQVVNQRKAIGTSYRSTQAGMEYVNTVAVPETSFELDVTKSSLSHFLWSLFQKSGFQGAATTYTKYFVPYEDPALEMWLTLVRKIAASGDANSHRMIGCVVKSISISGEAGGVIKATVGFQGYSTERNRDIASDTLTFSTNSVLLFQDLTCTVAGSAANIDKFTFNITNNAVTKFFDSATAVHHLLGDFTVDGSVTIPWSDSNRGGNTEINAFVAGTPSRLNINWGGHEIASSDGDFSIISHIRRTNTQPVGDDEIMLEVSFEGASEENSSSVTTASASSIAIGGNTTVTGTNTKFANFAVGDLLYPYGCTAAGDKTIRVITTIASDTSMTVFPAFSGTESSKLYYLKSTPCTISLVDSASISGM